MSMEFSEIVQAIPFKPYYQDEWVVIYHGDCREILPLLPKVDLVLTDPPYIIKEMHGDGFPSAEPFYHRGKGSLLGLCDFHLSEYSQVLRNASDQCVICHSRDQVAEYASHCLQAYGHYDLHFWYKVNAIPFTHNTWKSDVEYIALGWSQKHHQRVPQNDKSKVFISGIDTLNFHPAGKPLMLMAKYINVLTALNETVLDPFLGSGTTAVAAKQLNRHCIGIEIEEKYCAIAARRCSQSVMTLDIPEVKKPYVSPFGPDVDYCGSYIYE